MGPRIKKACHARGDMMSMRKALLALLLAAAVTPAMAQEKNFELKLSHWVPASHPLQKALEEWGAAVEKETGGTVKSKRSEERRVGKEISSRWASYAEE